MAKMPVATLHRVGVDAYQCKAALEKTASNGPETARRCPLVAKPSASCDEGIDPAQTAPLRAESPERIRARSPRAPSLGDSFAVRPPSPQPTSRKSARPPGIEELQRGRAERGHEGRRSTA
jgi:hypothetical protein